MYLLFFLIIPAIFAIYACKSDKYVFKALETIACLLIVSAIGLYFNQHHFWYLSSAFFASILGDYFLSYKHKGKNYFVYGIALYFLAHIGYLLYIVMSFEINVIVFAIALAALVSGYLAYYFGSLKKNISGIMTMAVLMYLIISCGVLALSISIETLPMIKALLVAAITLIVLSDTIIAESDFANRKRFSFLILPTYYAAQILLCASFIILNFAG